MPVVLLIRHAENDYVKKGRLAGRLPGVHLNEKGRQQAERLAGLLKQAPLKAIYSSPLERALETAAPLAAAVGLEAIPAPGLIELDVGDWQGQSLKALRRLKVWKTVQYAPSLMRFPNGEAFADAQGRIRQTISELCARHDPKDMIACVSHSDPIKLAAAFFIGLPLDQFQRLHVAPCSITSLLIGDSGSSLLNLNVDLSFTFPKA
jgi:probable phosphoglycerate mutase